MTRARQKFHLINCSKDLFSSLHDLKHGSRSVVEFSEEFVVMKVRCDLNKTKDVCFEQDFHGLKIYIQHILEF